jgi:hypothetical protein
LDVIRLLVEHLDSSGGYLHVVNEKGGKRRTFIIHRPVIDALGCTYGLRKRHAFADRIEAEDAKSAKGRSF